MDGCGWMWMDGWIGRSIPVISHSAKSNSIQWYTLLVCPSLSFLGRYLEDTEHCYLIMPGMYIMTLNANIGLLGFLRGHKNLEQCGEWTSGRCHFSDSTSASIENTVVHLYLKINFTRSFNNEMQTNSRLTLKLCDLDRDPNINHI